VLWGIPASIVTIVAYHHRPSESIIPKKDAVAAVHIAQSLLDIISYPAKPPAMDWAYISNNGLSTFMPEWLKYASDCCDVHHDELARLLVTPMDEKVWHPNE
jgi:hypothetical protein